MLDQLFEKGHIGEKSGRGYFLWEGRDPSALFHERDKRLLALKRALRQIGRLAGGMTVGCTFGPISRRWAVAIRVGGDR